MQNPWFLALVITLVVCATSEARMRVWSALGIGAIAGQLLPPLSVPVYIAVDFLAASLIMRKPAGVAQKAIGALSGLMVLFHAGWLLSEQSNWQSYYLAQYAIGWIQLAILAGWGAVANVRYILGSSGIAGGEAVVRAGIR